MWDIHRSCQLKKVELATWVPDLAPGQIRRPPPPTRKFSASYHVVGLDFYFWPPGPPLGFFRKTHPQVVIPIPYATHMQIFSLLACRWAGFLFWGFCPPGRP